MTNIDNNKACSIYFCIEVDDPKYDQTNFEITASSYFSFVLPSIYHNINEYKKDTKIKIIEVFIKNLYYTGYIMKS